MKRQTLFARGDVVSDSVKTVADFKDAIDPDYLRGHSIQTLFDAAATYIESYPDMIVKQKEYRAIDAFEAVSTICQNLPHLANMDFSTMTPDPNSTFAHKYGFEADLGTGWSFPDQLGLCQVVKPTSMVTDMVD